MTLYVWSFRKTLDELNKRSSDFLLNYATGVGQIPVVAEGRDEDDANRYLKGLISQPCASMIKMLLEEGCDPNESRGHGTSPWQSLLEHLRKLSRWQKLSQVWFDICKLFITFGADIHSLIGDGDGGHKKQTAGRQPLRC